MRLIKVLAAVVLAPLVIAALFVAYLYIGTVTGYFERRDERELTSFTLSTGGALGQQLENRLRERGVLLPVSWSTGCYGSASISIACVRHADTQVCAAFDYNHHGHVAAGNPLAQALFPELPVRGGAYGLPLDTIGLSSLALVRRPSWRPARTGA